MPVGRHGGTRGKRRTDFQYSNGVGFYRKITEPFLARNRYALRILSGIRSRVVIGDDTYGTAVQNIAVYLVGGRRARNRYALRGHRGTLFRASGGDDCYSAAVENIADKEWERNV